MHIQLCFLFLQDLVAAGVVRLRNVPTKGNLADLRTKFLPLVRLRFLCDLQSLRSPMAYMCIQRIMQKTPRSVGKTQRSYNQQ